jgi:hypothetical protein
MFLVDPTRVVTNIKEFHSDFVESTVSQVGVILSEDLILILKLIIKSDKKVPGHHLPLPSR